MNNIVILKPGDTIIIRADKAISRHEFNSLSKKMCEIGINCIVLTQGTKIEAVVTEEKAPPY